MLASNGSQIESQDLSVLEEAQQKEARARTQSEQSRTREMKTRSKRAGERLSRVAEKAGNDVPFEG